MAPDGRHLGLGDKLATRGYHSTLETSILEPTPAPQGEHPDVIILIGAAANWIEPGPGPRAPVMVIGGDPQAAEKIRTNRDVVVDALPDDFNDLELFARVHSLVRLNTMR